jgi:hypothetical protein
LPLRRSAVVARSVLAVTALLASGSGPVAGSGDPEPTELIFEHVNDLLADTEASDDLYTSTTTLGVRHRGWEYKLSENMFTDRFVNGVRFDETYLTVARDFTPGVGWLVRAQAGAVHVGEGLFGEPLQNFIHRLINHDEYVLQYVEDGTHVVLGLRASRPLTVSERFTLTPFVELESAGFREHALVAVAASYEAGPKFTLVGDCGYRWTTTDFAALDLFVVDNDPTFGIGMSYGRRVDLRWTKNYFGTGSNHWHLLLRFPVGKNSD